MTDHIKHAPLSTTSFRDVNAAEKTYEDLLAKGYTEKDIHVMMSDETRKKLAGQHVKLEHGNKSLEGAGVAAWSAARSARRSWGSWQQPRR